jgi:hypothetical protein
VLDKDAAIAFALRLELAYYNSAETDFELVDVPEACLISSKTTSETLFKPDLNAIFG